MAIQDRRVRRTQHALATALIALTLQKGYDTITIRDITECADVGYATFFRHYPDKDALLHDVLDVVLNELMEMLPSLSSDVDPATVGTLLFRYVQEHSELVRVLLSTRVPSSMVRHIVERSTQGVLSNNGPREDSPVPTAIAASHLVTSSIALIQWWLEHEMPYSVERMGTIYRELIILPTKQVAFQD